MASLGPAVSDLPWVAPDAPEPIFWGGPGRQWFSVQDITAEGRPLRVKAARDGFDRVMQDVMAAQEIDDPADLVLVGFSQGTIMALDAVASGRWPVGAVVGFSGRLASPTLSPVRVPVSLWHGGDDPVIAPQESIDACQRLRSHGVPVRLTIQPGLGHSISAEGLAAARGFLQGVA